MIKFKIHTIPTVPSKIWSILGNRKAGRQPLKAVPDASRFCRLKRFQPWTSNVEDKHKLLPTYGRKSDLSVNVTDLLFYVQV